MISFGVDFFVHATGRVREAQRQGVAGRLAYARGLTVVSGALLVAVTSSAAAFLANTGSGIEAIVDFGIGTAAALAVAFVLLGIVGPRLVIAIEERSAPAPAPDPPTGSPTPSPSWPWRPCSAWPCRWRPPLPTAR